MPRPILTRSALAAFACLAAAGAARADQITNYPCSPKYVAAADFCAEVWAKTKDSTWMVFDVEFKNPVAAGQMTAADSARLKQYNGMFFNAYQVRSKDDTAKTLPMPVGDAQKWSYAGLAFRRYYANTVAMEDIIGKMTYQPPSPSTLRAEPAWRRGQAAGKAFTLDGRALEPKSPRAPKAKAAAPTVTR